MIILLVVIAGLLIGSFLNVVILRFHDGKSFVGGRSACPHCGHELTPVELIPVLSWLWQRGRCTKCTKPISIQYPLVEALTSIIFLVSYLSLPHTTPLDVFILLVWLVVAAGLLVLAVYDIRWYLLPDKIMLPLLAPAALLILVEAVAAQAPLLALKSVGAAILFGGAFYSIAAISKGKWMGGGDIKLAFLMGLLLGLQKTTLAMILAFWSAAIIGLILIISGKKKRKDYIPFGPFLIGGTIVAYLWGQDIITWYLRISGVV